MRYYIEAYGEDGKQVLGNLDGQASIEARAPERTNAWRRLQHKPVSSRIRFWKLVDATGRCIATKERYLA